MGVLAGNMFDWGAKEVASLMETTDFHFEQAQKKIPGNSTKFYSLWHANYIKIPQNDKQENFYCGF